MQAEEVRALGTGGLRPGSEPPNQVRLEEEEHDCAEGKEGAKGYRVAARGQANRHE